MSIIYIENRPKADYPKENFNPSKKYPEYPFSDEYIQKAENEVYDMVRECLHGLELDIKHYGDATWNPLGVYIKPGDHVIIKPNWVMHFNGAGNVSQNELACLVTHPSCLRAICDYCLIALKGTGQIIIGDAPMQDCDLPELLETAGFNRILSFYHNLAQPVSFMDFRKYQSVFNNNKVIIDKIYQNSEEQIVDMGSLSVHEKRKGKRVYQVDNYDPDETDGYHNKIKHSYSINKTVLDADVIINFCKPKSHRLAGFTAAMKNMVGIAYNKASLPHRVEGSIEEGGDAYLNKSKIKKQIDNILKRKVKHEDQHQLFLATCDRYLYGLLLVFEKKFGKDPYIKGIWYGNDTIWRTAVDLNYIEQYADKNGILQKTKQRKVLNFGDMIIAGEHNGPCQPEPKHMGVLVASDDAIAMDLIICKMIGFPEDKIPMIKGLKSGDCDHLFLDICGENQVISNIKQFTGSSNNIKFPDDWKYRPHDSWSAILR